MIFDDLLGFLTENFEIVGFRDLESVVTNRPLAILSFDDGYHNFIEYAIPLLEKHRLKANMNIIPACAESGIPIWNVRLYDFLNSTDRRVINSLEIPGFEKKLAGDSTSDRVNFGLAISSYLKNRPRSEREQIFEAIESTISQHEIRMTRMMDIKEIREVAGDHEIGVHSYSHESMAFESDEFFSADLAQCIGFFEEQLGSAVDIYAFPNGSYRESQLDILKMNGIRFPLLVDEDYSRRTGECFPRFTIYGNQRWEARFQALGINRDR
ncbi:MAG: polysaccharide deacetylase family protein [Acidobacteria bacterium]|nr:polysaccharide deacetylase family protein [Acidobacteriota bacterium]